MSRKRIIIIAGPNGAGKTTFAQEYLPNEADCPVFINADLIAAGLSPFRPELAAIKAARIMLREMHEHAARGDDFAFETTLAGRSYVPMIRKWRSDGYVVKLFFLSLENPEEAITRVAYRVAQGGHTVAEDVIRRRFELGLKNFHNVYQHEVDAWQMYDNRGVVPVLISEGSSK